MGNVIKETGETSPDLRRAVISIFAVLPAEAVAAKQAQVQDYIDEHGGLPGGFNAVMFGVIPLLTWGPQQSATEYEWEFPTITIPSHPGHTVDVVLAEITGSHTRETPPSFIGVYVDNTGAMSLMVHIQTQEAASCANTLNSIDGATFDTEADGGIGAVVYDKNDASYVDEAKPEYFGNSGIQPNDGSNGAYFGKPAITAGAETRVHLLVSYDITEGCAVHGVAPAAEAEIGTSAGTDTASKLWCAIDGVNKSGYDLPAMWAHWDTGAGDPNEMLSYIAASVAGNYGSDLGTPAVTLTTNATSVPFLPCAIPSETSLMREGVSFTPNLLVKEARIQFFAGVSIDTGNPDNVEAFRDSEGNPAPAAQARTLLGVPPIVEFVTGSAMKNGVNSGSAGNFTPNGTITEIATPP